MRKLPWSLSAPFLLLLLAINLVAGWHLAATASSARRQPNIILVMVCSLRADHLGCYGYDLPTSPNLDRFARESTRFARAVAPSSWTLWSTASVLTARYPERIFRQNDYVAESDLYPGLPAALANRGYQTIAVTSHPLLHNDVNFHFSQDFHSFTKLGGQDFTDKIAPEVTVRALERVTRSRPFFLFVMYADTHEPYTQHPEFVFGPSRRDTLNPDWLTTLPPTVRHRGMEPAVERHRRELLAKYNSEIAHTDRAIGRLFDGLRERGLYDDTLIIICGDHGEEFLEHGHYGHTNTLYPEVTDVPLLIKHPRQREGRLVEGTFSLIDLYPSILAMLGAPSAHLGLHGEGVNVPTLLRPAEKPLFQATVNGVRSVTDQGQMYYRGTRFAITEEKPFDGGFTFFIGQATHHLYNLRADARAYHDHAAARPDILKALRAQMHRHDVLLDERDAAFHRRATSLFDTEKARERLKSLGYLQ